MSESYKLFKKAYKKIDEKTYVPKRVESPSEIIEDILGEGCLECEELEKVKCICLRRKPSWADLVFHEQFGEPNHFLTRNEFTKIKKQLKAKITL